MLLTKDHTGPSGLRDAILVFDHIPKCAGTSVTRTLIPLLGEARYLDLYVFVGIAECPNGCRGWLLELLDVEHDGVVSVVTASNASRTSPEETDMTFPGGFWSDMEGNGSIGVLGYGFSPLNTEEVVVHA